MHTLTSDVAGNGEAVERIPEHVAIRRPVAGCLEEGAREGRAHPGTLKSPLRSSLSHSSVLSSDLTLGLTTAHWRLKYDCTCTYPLRGFAVDDDHAQVSRRGLVR